MTKLVIENSRRLVKAIYSFLLNRRHVSVIRQEVFWQEVFWQEVTWRLRIQNSYPLVGGTLQKTLSPVAQRAGSVI